MSRRGEQYVVVVRHGEREDSITGVEDPNGDTPLSEGGVKALSGVAKTISQLLPSTAEVGRATVRSSPFQRCRQTAAGIVQAGVGASNPTAPEDGFFVDNSICEVYGKVRIKRDEPPKLDVNKAMGTLPEWNETIEQAFDRFQSACEVCADYSYPNTTVLVTHGDAVSAILSRYYPNRTVYNCEYLGFIILRRTKLGGRFTCTHANGVDWMLEGPDPEEETDPVATAAEPPVVDYDVVEIAANGTQPNSSATNRSVYRRNIPSRDENTSSASATDLTNERLEGELNPTRPPVRRNPQAELGLHAVAVCSQLPMLRLWEDFRLAMVYVVAVVLSELAMRKAIRRLQEKESESMPLVGGDQFRFLRPVAQTVVKMACVFALYAGAGSVVCLANDLPTSKTVSSYTKMWTSVGTGVCLFAYVAADVARGWLANRRQC